MKTPLATVNRNVWLAFVAFGVGIGRLLFFFFFKFYFIGAEIAL